MTTHLRPFANTSSTTRICSRATTDTRCSTVVNQLLTLVEARMQCLFYLIYRHNDEEVLGIKKKVEAEGEAWRGMGKVGKNCCCVNVIDVAVVLALWLLLLLRLLVLPLVKFASFVTQALIVKLQEVASSVTSLDSRLRTAVSHLENKTEALERVIKRELLDLQDLANERWKVSVLYMIDA